MITEQDILRFLEGEASTAEVNNIEVWLAQSEDNRSHFNNTKSIWSASVSMKNYRTVDIEAEWDQFNTLISNEEETQQDQNSLQLTTKKSQFNFLPYSIAASLLILVGAFFYIQNQTSLPKQLEETQILSKLLFLETQQTTQTLTLSDETIVKLDSFSTLEYSSSFDADSIRQVSLIAGSAEFDVSHDESKKFVVLFEGISIEVLGTKFKLGKSNDQVKVSLSSGSIKAYQTNNKENSIIMNPGDQISFTGNSFVNIKKPIKKVIAKKIEKPVVIPEPPVKIKKEEPIVEEIVKEEVKGGNFRIRDVLDLLKRRYGKQLKIDRRLGVDKDESIRIDVNQTDLKLILKDLEEVTTLQYKPGKCADCYIITAGSKK